MGRRPTTSAPRSRRLGPFRLAQLCWVAVLCLLGTDCRAAPGARVAPPPAADEPLLAAAEDEPAPPPAAAAQDAGGATDEEAGGESDEDGAGEDQEAEASDPPGDDGADPDTDTQEGTGDEDAPPAESEEPAEEAAADTGEAPPPVVSEAERLQRLRDDIQSDEGRLEALRYEVESKEEFFEELTAARDRLTIELEELEAEDPESTEAIEVRTRLERVKTQTDLNFQALQALRKQKEALLLKIEQSRVASDQIEGVSRPAETAETTKPEAGSGAGSGEGGGTGLPIPIPGMPKGGAPAAPDAGTPTGRQTAEQIEAEQKALRAEDRAAQAEQAVIDFLQRKAILEDQIELEEQLLAAAEGSYENLREAAEERKDTLRRQIAEDAGRQALADSEEAIDLIGDLAEDAREEIDFRHDQLTLLRKRMQDLHEEQLTLTAEAETKREEAEEARRESIWLTSPFHPRNLGKWFFERGPRMLLVIAAALATLLLIRLTLGKVARAVIRRGRGDRASAGNRAHTLATSFRSASTVLITVISFLLVLQEAGLDVKTVLGGAAILGVAIAFGAQNLMRDYFTGFLILLEDQFEIGDLVTIGNITGTVERVNMRTTMLRDLEGRMHFIPNGEIKSVTNRTYIWGRAVLEIPVGFDEDVERVMDLVMTICREFSAEPEWAPAITDEPQMLGVDKFTEAGVVIKFMLRTVPEKMFAVRRELLRRIKNRFDAEGIRISVPHRIMVPGQAEAPPG